MYACRILIIIFTFCSCQGQNSELRSQKKIGGPCEGCEAALEYDRKLSEKDTLPHFDDAVIKLKLTGTVFKKDGRTPAENVIIYIYKTDQNGICKTIGDEEGWAKRHGYIRGWVKTNSDGKYSFYTFRPGAYPNSQEPEHIHVTIKEPHKNPYYIDEFVFLDDPLLTQKAKLNLDNRGGSGVIQPRPQDNMLIIERDIVLGLNIPNYK